MANAAVPAMYEILERRGPGGRLVLASVADGDRRRIAIAGYDGPELPAALTIATIDSPAPGDRAAGRWCLRSIEGDFSFRARAVEVIDERPGLYEPLHRPFLLSGADRFAVRVLLWMLRLPGGARLLRRWHAGRSP